MDRRTGLWQGHRFLYRGIQTISPHPLWGQQPVLLDPHSFWVPHIMLLQQSHQATLGHCLAAAYHPTLHVKPSPTASLQFSLLRHLAILLPTHLELPQKPLGTLHAL